MREVIQELKEYVRANVVVDGCDGAQREEVLSELAVDLYCELAKMCKAGDQESSYD